MFLGSTFKTFTLSELLRDNQQGEGVFLKHPQSRFGLNESESKIYFPGHHQLPMTKRVINKFSFMIGKRVYRKKYGI